MSDTVQKFDLVVVGAGMVGSLFVLRLLNSPLAADLRIAVIEGQQSHLPDADAAYALRVSSLSLASEQLIAGVGCAEALSAQRHCAFTDMKVWDADGTGRVHFLAQEVGESHLGSLYENDSVQSVLCQALWRQPQVTAFCPDRLHDAQRLLHGWQIHTQSGAVLETPLLIAADGALSRTRELAGIACKLWDYQQQGLVATVRTEKPHANTAWQRFLDTGPLAFLPLDKAHYSSIVWTLPTAHAEQMLACSEHEFNQALTQAFEQTLGQVEVVGKRAAFPLLARHAEHYVQPGLALIGDVAHSIHPLAGQGVNLGFLDAAALADRLIQGLSKGLSIHDESSLRRYSRDRRAQNELFMHSMTGLEWLFANHRSVIRMARNQGLRWFDRSGPLKQWVMSTALGKSSEI